MGYAEDLIRARGLGFSTLHLREYAITPCGHCGDCNFRTAPCWIDDDVPAIVERMVAADAIIYATPVHGFGMAHLMQIFIERAGVGYLRYDRPLANKVGGAIVLSRRYNDTHVFQQLMLNMLLNRMIVVGSGFPALLHGGRHGDVADDKEGLDALDRMVHRLADMVELLRDHRDVTGRQPLVCDDLNERQSRPGTTVLTRSNPR